MNTQEFRANYHSKSMGKPRYIYALVDPRDSRVRYVGCSYEPEKRLQRQTHEARKASRKSKYISIPENMPPRLRWLNKLEASGEKAILVILERCEYREWRERENHWIVKLNEAGANLTNIRTSAGFDNIEHDDYKRVYRHGNRMIRIIFTANGARAIDITNNEN